MRRKSDLYETVTVKIKLRDVPASYGSEKMTQPEKAAHVLRSFFDGLDAMQEHFVLLALNTDARIVGIKCVASGGMDTASVDPRIVFRTALLMGAARLIVCHNHPSGNGDPSTEDRLVTRRLVMAGECLGLPVEDHIILYDGGFHSMRANGEM